MIGAVRSVGQDIAGTIIHQDQDTVFTSYPWPEVLLLESGAPVPVSYSENGARGNPWIEAFWARLRAENHSVLLEATIRVV